MSETKVLSPLKSLENSMEIDGTFKHSVAAGFSIVESNGNLIGYNSNDTYRGKSPPLGSRRSYVAREVSATVGNANENVNESTRRILSRQGANWGWGNSSGDLSPSESYSSRSDSASLTSWSEGGAGGTVPGTGEGKRLREKSESESEGFLLEADLVAEKGRDSCCGGVELWLGGGGGGGAGAKRPRDISPNVRMNSVGKAVSGKEVVIGAAANCENVVHNQLNGNQDCESDSTSLATESDLEDSDGPYPSDGDDDASLFDGDDEQCAEDDQLSVLSSLTSISCTSLTPSVVGETLGNITLGEQQSGDQKTEAKPLRTGLFPFVPPFINFSVHDEKVEDLPWEIRKHLKWKLSTITPLVIRQTLSNSGYRLVKKTSEWVGTWGKHMKSVGFKTLKEFQKINHFPGTFQIGRKDRLWRNLHRLMLKFGSDQFGFIPRTFILPQDTKLLRQCWDCKEGKQKWIVKPPASARGSGIKVVHRWGQVPKKRPLIVQKYVSRPFLINGSKFDLRLYVLVTSFNPLRIYLYEDGLVRFASVKYSSDLRSLGDKYMHLTNYSINKNSSHYTHNEDASACQGHKWTLRALWRYLEGRNINTKALWTSLVDMVIKTIISAETSISQLTANNITSRYCCYELFGFDVIFDERLKPWLLEVNISPSLHSASPLDLSVKGPMVRDVLNLARFHVPAKMSASQQSVLIDKLNLGDQVECLCLDKRLYTLFLSREEKHKQSYFASIPDRKQYIGSILKDLSPDDVRHLIEAEDELSVAGQFVRIFPTPNTYKYFPYFESIRYYNQLFDAWESKYHRRREEGISRLEAMCQKKVHLVVAPPVIKPKLYASPTNPSEPNSATSCDNEKQVKKPSSAGSSSRRAVTVSTMIQVRPHTAHTHRSAKFSVVSRRPMSRHQFERRPQTAVEKKGNCVTGFSVEDVVPPAKDSVQGVATESYSAEELSVEKVSVAKELVEKVSVSLQTP